MTALVTILVFVGSYIVLVGVRDFRRNRADRRLRNSFLGVHERNRRARQRDEIVKHQQVRL